ncbi:MAG: phage portal protein [SAR202 cluster bacterium]|nr:phage portal protein [SAR202 cluster bacterium]
MMKGEEEMKTGWMSRFKFAMGGMRAGRAGSKNKRASRVAPALSARWERESGAGAAWTPAHYGEYFARSAMVYAAIKVRQDAVAQVAWVATGDNAARLQALLDRPNPFWTRGDLWRATECYLGLWGSAFWGLERDEAGEVSEIWPLRPDRMRVVPDSRRYIRGFVYVSNGVPTASYTPDDVVWMRYFNPLDEYSGLSPIAPLRLSADMGMDALRASRNNLRNDSMPGMFIETTDTPGDDEITEFYDRWERRYGGVENVRRPALLSPGMRVTSLGFSPREMEYLHTLRWGLEDIARVYGVPKPMLGDIEHLNMSNFATARRVFWEDTIVPQLVMYREAMSRWLGTVNFDLSGIEALRENENDKATRRALYVSHGILTPQEVRQEMGLV